MMISPFHSQPTVESGRGVTLIEVLMSLMIMSIGISAVMVLFPISVLRSVQATQLTNSAILKYNAEGMIRRNPKFIFDPDGNGNLIEHVRAAQKRYLIDPIGYATALQDSDGDTLFSSRFGQSLAYSTKAGFTSPDFTYKPLPLRYGGGLESSPLLSGLPAGQPVRSEHFRAMILQAMRTAKLGDKWTTMVDTFGELVTTGDYPTGGAVLLPEETDLSDLGFITIASDPNVFRVPFPVTAPQVPDSESFRVVVFSVDGKFSQSFPLAGLVNIGTPINPRWSVPFGEDLRLDNSLVLDVNLNQVVDRRSLAREFPGQIGRVMIQTNQRSDFFWLMTVRRAPDGAARGVDIVVRYAQTAGLADEFAFLATFVAGTNFVGVIFADNAEPVFKKGGYVFDALNARWYRISDYVLSPNNSPYDAILTVENEINEPAGEDQLTRDENNNSILLNGQLDAIEVRDNNGNPVLDANGNPIVKNEDRMSGADNDGNLDFGIAVFLPGVIDVYPMGSISMPSDF